MIVLRRQSASGGRKRAGLLFAALAIGPLAFAGVAFGEPAKHGRDITAANTGPAAGGYKALKPFTGGPLVDGRSYPFARRIEVAATYDGFSVPAPHILVEGAAFSEPLDISIALPVVFRGVSVRVGATNPWTILVRPGSGPVYFLWSEAGGGGDGTAAPSKAVASALDLRGAKTLVFRSHLSHAADGIDVSGGGGLIAETLIDDLALFPGSHNDAIQLAATAADLTIARSKILNRNPQTSGIYVLGTKVRIADNYLAGGGWTLYGGTKSNGHAGPSASHVEVTGNVFGREYYKAGGHFGPVTYWDAAPALGNVWKGNRFADGVAINP